MARTADRRFMLEPFSQQESSLVILAKLCHLEFDPDLLYVSAVFRDLGITNKYTSEAERYVSRPDVLN
jgi:hypothetical protein